MAFIEHSDGERNAEKVWSQASEYFVRRENHRRRSEGMTELRTKGIPDCLRSERQVKFDEEAQIVDRVRLLRAEALLSDVRAELARSKK
jgi:hypothetical protein